MRGAVIDPSLSSIHIVLEYIGGIFAIQLRRGTINCTASQLYVAKIPPDPNVLEYTVSIGRVIAHSISKDQVPWISECGTESHDWNEHIFRAWRRSSCCCCKYR